MIIWLKFTSYSPDWSESRIETNQTTFFLEIVLETLTRQLIYLTNDFIYLFFPIFIYVSLFFFLRLLSHALHDVIDASICISPRPSEMTNVAISLGLKLNVSMYLVPRYTLALSLFISQRCIYIFDVVFFPPLTRDSLFLFFAHYINSYSVKQVGEKCVW